MAFVLANVDGRAALVHDSAYYDLERVSNGTFSSDPMSAIARFEELHSITEQLDSAEPDGEAATAPLQAPVPSPQKGFGIGLNYRAHAEETGSELPQAPVVFSKYPSCLNSPNGEIELRTDTGDYEAELVVVIGKQTRDVSTDDVWAHLAGLTCGQDISDRRLQRASTPPHFGLGKSRDSYGPIGPWIVSIDSFADPTDLAITCDVNNERRQESRTNQLLFDIPFLVSYLSNVMTLQPGDLIFTGTPAGVGAPTKNFLKPGDEIRTEIEGIGVITNVCR